MKKFLLFLALTALPLFALEEIAKNVKRINDKVYIDNIPQVSQKRNYCAPASISMVLRYYDANFPQNKLARFFDTSQKHGTPTADLVAAFDSGNIPGFSIRYVYAMSKPEFNALFDAYGGCVSKSKMYKIVQKGDHAFEAADPSIAVPLFAKQRKNLHDLLILLLKGNIDNGVPMLWTVEMNFDPEDRMPGAHMRVIIGYTVDKQGEIVQVLYRDPWGNCTNYKSMSLDNAVAMTYEILVITPTEKTPKE